MSDGEFKIADTRGRFAQVVKDGNKLRDVAWTGGRVILSNKRLVLVGNKGKRTIPLSAVTNVGGRYDVNQSIAQVGGYVSLAFENDVLLVEPTDAAAFRMDVFRALLDQRIVLVRHPAVEGGVVQDTDWEKARIKVDDDVLNLAIANGTYVGIEYDDIGTLEVAERTVRDEKRAVIEAEHTDDGTSVQTYLSGTDHVGQFLEALLRSGEKRNEGEIDLDQTEREVLMGLYSGVSPFEIPDFLGLDVDRVEAIYERLVQLDVLDEVRVRREVTLKARGRNIASEAMNDQ